MRNTVESVDHGSMVADLGLVHFNILPDKTDIRNVGTAIGRTFLSLFSRNFSYKSAEKKWIIVGL